MSSLFVIALIDNLHVVVCNGIIHNGFTLPATFIAATYIMNIRLAWSKSAWIYRLSAIKRTVNVLHWLARVTFLTTWRHQRDGHQDKQGLLHTAKVYKQFFNIQTRIT